MAEYVVSARKYRPASFETLVGQDNISRTLKNSIVRGQLAHAYLFCGPRGVGKTSTARIFAKTINCSNPGPDMEPCGECESCKAFQEGRSYCIHEMDAASNNSVEDIRMLMEKVQIPPQTGKYSVYIIDEVHMLSSAAFNAFLKTLEEPPAHAIFILATTEKHKILPTILSRCQTYDFNRIGIADMVANLRGIASKEGISIDDRSLGVIARKADGAMRDALTIFDQTVAFCGTEIKYQDVIRNLNVLDDEYGFRLTDFFLKGDYASALLTFDEILSKGFNALYFLSALGDHLRNLLVSKTGALSALLDVPDSVRGQYKSQADACSVKFIYDALGVISQCEAGYKAAVNQRLHIEFALMRLSFLTNALVAGVPTSASPAGAVASTSAEKRGEASAEATAPALTVKRGEVSAEASAPGSTGFADGGKYAAEVAAPASTEKRGEASAQAATPAAPAPEKKKAVSSGFSLRSMSSADKQSAESKEENDGESAQELMPSDELVRQAWATLPEKYSSQPRMANLLKNSELEMSDSDGVKTVVLTVTSEAQRSWLKAQHQRTIEEVLRTFCKYSKVVLDVQVIMEEEKEERVYLQSEKAKVIMDNNPEVRAMVSDFGLDVK